MARSGRLLAIVTTISTMAACETGGVTEQELSTVRALCVSPVGDAELEVTATMDVCISVDCEKVAESSCTITANADGVLEVEASAVVQSRDGACNTECGAVVATCRFPSVLPQIYLLRANDGDVEVEYDAVSGRDVCGP